MKEFDELMAALAAFEKHNYVTNRTTHSSALLDAYRAYLAASQPLVLEWVRHSETTKCWYISREVVNEIKLDGECYRLPEGQ